MSFMVDILRGMGFTETQKFDAAVCILAENARARLAGACEPYTDSETGQAIDYLEDHGGY